MRRGAGRVKGWTPGAAPARRGSHRGRTTPALCGPGSGRRLSRTMSPPDRAGPDRPNPAARSVRHNGTLRLKLRSLRQRPILPNTVRQFHDRSGRAANDGRCHCRIRGCPMSTTVQGSEREARAVAEAAREKDGGKPRFVRELFLGRLRLDLIYPAPKPDPEAERRADEFLARAEAFLRENADPEQIEREERVPDHVIPGLKELGAFGLKIPREYGGLELSQRGYNRAIAVIGSYSVPLGVLLSAHQSIGVPQPLKMFGTEEQKKKYLPRLARGEISAFALTEPDVGSDPARVSATATPTEDGSAYILNGEKLWCTNGPIADIMLVM